jgi:regulator of sigma E protease
MTLFSIIVFVLIFSFLVIIHELGHFWAARKAGVRVEEFGLGLPPRIWGRKRGDTLYSLNAIPFGGFVKLKGEGTEEDTGSDSMKTKSYGQRFWIIVSGVGMNLLGAYVLLCIGMWFGMPPLATPPAELVADASRLQSKVMVMDVQEGLPADKAGIVPGDVVISVDGKRVATVADLQGIVAGKTRVEVVVKRNGQDNTFSVPTTKFEGSDVIGVAADAIVDKVNYPVAQVPVLAARDFGNIVGEIGKALGGFVGHLFATGSIQEGVSGPVGIARITAQAVNLGWLPVLQLMIFLSVNLGIINLFPFPALDGGRLVFLIAEILSGGRKVSTVVESIVHNLGFALLLILIAIVTYRDVLSLF